MDPTTVAAITAVSSTSTGGVLSVLLLVVLAFIPIIIKFWNWSKETSAQGMLYQQLSEMVQSQRKELDALYKEREKEKEENFELRRKVDSLIGYEQQVENLKKKLDQKDRIIEDRDKRITELLNDLMKMKDKLHQLELRLKADESKWCEGCAFKNNQYIPPTLEEN